MTEKQKKIKNLNKLNLQAMIKENSKTIKRSIFAYKTVFERNESVEFDFLDLVKYQHTIFTFFKLDDYKDQLLRIKNIEQKKDRNVAKREYIPAVDLSKSGIFSIDIDGISKNEELKKVIISRLSKLDTCLCVMESVSGNVVAFFKYKCTKQQFPFLYYKTYLELTLLLSVNIDFLPEINRLRYVSIGETYHLNENSTVLVEIMNVDTLPYINTQVNKDAARKAIFGSK